MDWKGTHDPLNEGYGEKGVNPQKQKKSHSRWYYTSHTQHQSNGNEEEHGQTH